MEKVSINETISFRKLKPTDINILLSEGFPYKWAMDQSLGNRLSKAAGLIPNRTGFVTYEVQENRPLGFLSLVKNTANLYLIGYLYVSPNHRKKGLATGLLNHAVSYASEHGGKKIFLNANSNDSSLLNFYLKRKFNLIVEASMVWGGGSPEKLRTETIDWSTSLEATPKEKNDQILELCNKCMGKKWIDFFELNRDNLINGFSQSYKHLYSKSAFILNSGQSLALVYKLPFPRVSEGFVELYISSDQTLPSLLNQLSVLLHEKGILYSKITVFNVNSSECFHLLEEKEFYPFQARILGRSI